MDDIFVWNAEHHSHTVTNGNENKEDEILIFHEHYCLKQTRPQGA